MWRVLGVLYLATLIFQSTQQQTSEDEVIITSSHINVQESNKITMGGICIQKIFDDADNPSAESDANKIVTTTILNMNPSTEARSANTPNTTTFIQTTLNDVIINDTTAINISVPATVSAISNVTTTNSTTPITTNTPTKNVTKTTTDSPFTTKTPESTTNSLTSQKTTSKVNNSGLMLNINTASLVLLVFMMSL